MSSPLPYPSERMKTLPEEINAATRQIHSHLNRLIIARIPLALPPYGNTPRNYTKGLLHFAQIYLNFEALWPPITEISSQQEPSHTDVKIQNILQHIYLPGLQRSTRLRGDLRMLLKLDNDSRLNLYLLAAANNSRLNEFIHHIEQAVKSKPHLLVAYAWVMYMAIFSGGRWIRSQLQTVPPDFWQQNKIDSESALPNGIDSHPGLEFFHFDGEYDGEDIKAEFKQRLAEVEVLFTPQEKDDIVAEALNIFRYNILFVEELDEILASQNEPLNPQVKGSTATEVTGPHPAKPAIALPTIPLKQSHVDTKHIDKVASPWLTYPYTHLVLLWTFILLVILNRYGFFIL
ncbi:MAG: hypothetical protein M1812_005394 [Candelaria pacifica]|nr:MAG: hypothetical protein M1812_005394 [Candelaria pacifica]